ncbi:HutD family protein [Kiloniella antarctica]|uniref:HutD family protein n=1 Tax=Kiloniella antarctica TaxID=1550907 RepID=A0ABW5BIZ5_9PROT
MKKHLKQSDYKSMPWKNGLGTTVELAVCVHEMGVEDGPFLWRISIASVSEDGAFSHFPNIDRNLTILQGRGMVLEVAGFDDLRLDQPLQSVCFSGEADVVARLHDGPITDFNVMVDRRFAEARVETFSLDDEVSLILSADDSYFLHVPETSTAIMLSGDEADVQIDGGESYLFEGIEQHISVRSLTSTSASLILVKVTFSPSS